MPTGRGSVEKKQLPFNALGFSARLKHKLQDVRQHITCNSGGRTQCWEISDRQPVASALLVFLDVLEGPEGDMHLCQLLIAILQPLQVSDPEFEGKGNVLS